MRERNPDRIIHQRKALRQAFVGHSALNLQDQSAGEAASHKNFKKHLQFCGKCAIIVQHLKIRPYLTGEVKMPCGCGKPRVFCDSYNILTNGWSAASALWRTDALKERRDFRKAEPALLRGQSMNIRKQFKEEF